MTKFPHLSRIFIITLLVASIASCSLQQNHKEKRKVGVAFLVQGGFEEFGQSGLWDSTLQIFAYDQNSFVYKNVIWSERDWPMILGVGNAPKERGKYAFESERLGGPDPAMRYSRKHAAQLRAALNEASDDLDPSLA
jgi:hypothetical protein